MCSCAGQRPHFELLIWRNVKSICNCWKRFFSTVSCCISAPLLTCLQSPAAPSASLLFLLFCSCRPQSLSVWAFEFRCCKIEFKPSMQLSLLLRFSSLSFICVFSVMQTDANLEKMASECCKTGVSIQAALCCGSVECKLLHQIWESTFCRFSGYFFCWEISIFSSCRKRLHIDSNKAAAFLTLSHVSAWVRRRETLGLGLLKSEGLSGKNKHRKRLPSGMVVIRHKPSVCESCVCMQTQTSFSSSHP